ncbi:mitotic checkpoint regulator, MAD2B-interacting-domain-containing protein [Mycena amicta]|nr:mitotic checkpoint regulator, MAD2B-interacting-domain-containing protein [Mycena amicta]
MNLGLGDYGSDSELESDNETAPVASVAVEQKTIVAKKRPPKKITIGLPARKSADDLDDQQPPAKKARLDTGAGRSSLLSMLPAPKDKNPVLAPPQRTLGGRAGPALSFNAETADAPSESIAFLPTSLSKGRTNVNVEEDASNRPPKRSSSNVDFFSLGETSTSQSAVASSSTSRPSVSSAPAIPKFEPPEPSPTDPYPGYYTLPSGAWAAYDPAYYAKFAKKWQAEYDAHVRALEKGRVKGFEELDKADVEEIDAAKEMEKAKKEVQEREARKAITAGAGSGPSAPSIKLTASKSSRIANTRHQLATMLHQAYANREALEEKIAEGKRNRKEAGNKYGF